MAFQSRGSGGCTALVAMMLALSVSTAQGEVNLSLAITDAGGNPLDVVDPHTNDPALGGGDFYLELRTSDATDLATYSQRIGFDSTKVTYANSFLIGLIPELGQKAGLFQVNPEEANAGEDAALIVSSIGIEAFTGPQTLVKLSFNVLEGTLSGEIDVVSNPLSTVPYGNAEPRVIQHTHSGPVQYVVSLEGTPTVTPTLFFTPIPPTPTPTETTFTPTPTETAFTPTPTPDADFNGDGIVDAEDLLILIEAMRKTDDD